MKHCIRFLMQTLTPGWPVGSLALFAVVVDLPLATSVLQNVFGTPETPVFSADPPALAGEPIVAGGTLQYGVRESNGPTSLEKSLQVLFSPALDAYSALP